MTAIEASVKPVKNNIEFFTLTTEDGITVDGWLAKPDNFDSTKKYPLVLWSAFEYLWWCTILPNILENKIHLANISQRLFDFRSSQGSTELAVNNIVEISF